MIDTPDGRYHAGPIRTPDGAAPPAVDPPACLSVPVDDLRALVAWLDGKQRGIDRERLERIRHALNAYDAALRRYNLDTGE